MHYESDLVIQNMSFSPLILQIEIVDLILNSKYVPQSKILVRYLVHLVYFNHTSNLNSLIAIRKANLFCVAGFIASKSFTNSVFIWNHLK